MEIQDLPYELIQKSAFDLDCKSLVYLCSTNKYYKSILCDNPDFWRSRLEKRGYGNLWCEGQTSETSVEICKSLETPGKLYRSILGKSDTMIVEAILDVGDIIYTYQHKEDYSKFYLVLNKAGEVFSCFYNEGKYKALPIEFADVEIYPKIKWACRETLCDIDNNIYEYKGVVYEEEVSSPFQNNNPYILIYENSNIEQNVPSNIVDVTEYNLLLDADGYYYYYMEDYPIFLKIKDSNRFKNITVHDLYDDHLILIFVGLTMDDDVFVGISRLNNNLSSNKEIDPFQGRDVVMQGIGVIGRIDNKLVCISNDNTEIESKRTPGCVEKIKQLYFIEIDDEYVDYYFITDKRNLYSSRLKNAPLSNDLIPKLVSFDDYVFLDSGVSYLTVTDGATIEYVKH